MAELVYPVWLVLALRGIYELTQSVGYLMFTAGMSAIGGITESGFFETIRKNKSSGIQVIMIKIV